MKRQIKWNKPVSVNGWQPVRTSKCGRFKITTRGNATRLTADAPRAFYIEQDGHRVGSAEYTLADALDTVETLNDPNWEPG